MKSERGWGVEPGEQQLALSRGPGEGAGEEVSIALLLQRLPDTGSEREVKRKEEEEEEGGLIGERVNAKLS